MSEAVPSRPELLRPPERHELLPDAEHAEPLRPGESDPLTLQEARQVVAETALEENPLQRLEAAENAPQGPQPAFINQELRRITLRRELQHLQRQLPLPERSLSRVIHQPIIRKASEVAGQSLTRPSGLFGGGLAAFLGSSAYLYLAKHIGFTYNYVIFWLLFATGFVFGIILEGLVWLLISYRRRSDS
jgi:hypothetical protein